MHIKLTERRAISPTAIQLTTKQANIFVFGWQPYARFRYAVCGRRFGKTYLAIEEIKRAYRLAVKHNIHPDNEIWYGAPIFKQAKRVFWNRLKRAIPEEWLGGKPNNTECVLSMRCGRILRLVGLDDIDALRGSGLWFFVGDEWDDAKPEAWSEAIRPMLASAGGHALKIGTPKGFGMLYDGYNDGQPGRFKVGEEQYVAELHGRDPFTMSWKYNSIEGGNVPQHEIDHARRTLDPRTFRQEWEASFETYSGRVYYDFDRRESVKSIDYDPSRPIHVGMDFNVNPMTASLWQERTEGGEVISEQFREIVIPTSNTHEMAREIATLFPDAYNAEQIWIYPDPAGAQNRSSAQGETDISILRKSGFHVYAMSSHPLVRDRVNYVNSRIKTADGHRHLFVDPSCRHTITALERQVYKEGTSEPEKGEHDHFTDNVGYYIFTRFAHQKPHTAQMPPIFGT